jgi:hypothetical protein
MAKKDKGPTKGKGKGVQSAQTAQATVARSRQSETVRGALLVLPPEPTDKEVKAREACIDKTHRAMGPELIEGPRKRKAARAADVADADLPETIPMEPSQQ